MYYGLFSARGARVLSLGQVVGYLYAVKAHVALIIVAERFRLGPNRFTVLRPAYLLFQKNHRQREAHALNKKSMTFHEVRHAFKFVGNVLLPANGGYGRFRRKIFSPFNVFMTFKQAYHNAPSRFFYLCVILTIVSIS